LYVSYFVIRGKFSLNLKSNKQQNMRGRKSKMEAIIRKIGDTARPNRLIPTIIKSQLDKNGI